ncbi:8-demethyl-8-aminoriboflavin-5'-phosphate (AFP) synthase RosB [Salipaludibacillus neizhouensis]|uniref:8-demethyl-8-aminoriboflavin-5'-phosphate (AFP) synthase RosB n=1 Tax=Salipaludibacillus neizhouensis TaxID=885475 RepID=A0A3A9KF83_9BACI|nr:flavodoxin family protein [Salipaludibacillus neizhouensis]RKL69241.1 8-demethyl-8-aminoriboflavin-5'-phosphate (AFP) synthase RosB [Salipaludibacillus neizhouensis]
MFKMKALMLNCSLKTSEEESHTSSLLQKAAEWLNKEGTETEEIRIADYQVSPGMAPDMGNGDEWPKIMEKVLSANIVIIGTPIWIGEKSSISTLVVERLYASSAETNEKGQAIYYNKVGGAVVTGNEDGAKESAKSILYGLQHIGFTVPPNVDAYWVGEAGPGPSYIEGGKDNEFTNKNTKVMSYNLLHFARMLHKHPIPAIGNTN